MKKDWLTPAIIGRKKGLAVMESSINYNQVIQRDLI